ncbi:hypothetical protein ABPG74_012749 [Tetrahymena malaccensis]
MRESKIQNNIFPYNDDSEDFLQLDELHAGYSSQNSSNESSELSLKKDDSKNIDHEINNQSYPETLNEELSTKENFFKETDFQERTSQINNCYVGQQYSQNYSNYGCNFNQNLVQHQMTQSLSEEITFTQSHIYEQSSILQDQSKHSAQNNELCTGGFDYFNSYSSDNDSIRIQSTNESSEQSNNSQNKDNQCSQDQNQDENYEDDESNKYKQEQYASKKSKKIQKQKLKQKAFSDQGINSDQGKKNKNKQISKSEQTKNHLRNYMQKLKQIIRKIESEEDWPIKRIRPLFEKELQELKMSIQDFIQQLKQFAEQIDLTSQNFNGNRFIQLYRISSESDKSEKILKSWFRELSFIFYSEKMPIYLFFDNIRVQKETIRLQLDLVPQYLMNIIDPISLVNNFSKDRKFEQFEKTINQLYDHQNNIVQ